MEDEGAGNCGKHAFTRKNWGKKAWAIAEDTGNFADSKRQPPLRAWRKPDIPAEPRLGIAEETDPRLQRQASATNL